jgi:hypothetical protein
MKTTIVLAAVLALLVAGAVLIAPTHSGTSAAQITTVGDAEYI